MVAVPNTNVYLVVLDGGECPDSAIKCTSVSNAGEFRMRVCLDAKLIQVLFLVCLLVKRNSGL